MTFGCVKVSNIRVPLYVGSSTDRRHWTEAVGGKGRTTQKTKRTIATTLSCRAGACVVLRRERPTKGTFHAGYVLDKLTLQVLGFLKISSFDVFDDAVQLMSAPAIFLSGMLSYRISSVPPIKELYERVRYNMLFWIIGRNFQLSHVPLRWFRLLQTMHDDCIFSIVELDSTDIRLTSTYAGKLKI
ncbi:unnamed protein product [Acanthoscelides obtectus]|uniref:Uncharacterized protein n=1 Tax=Acanthoscelides obtectus TaxID=200917 RepID=A0A9P0Q020_ACAOB|nr:unnamed protein product [Acanthoscelides obtectus]CAK1625630.1 hypothetical protein AOBTE_LOCUS3287 [Acanthoscelides obtectus]